MRGVGRRPKLACDSDRAVGVERELVTLEHTQLVRQGSERVRDAVEGVWLQPAAVLVAQPCCFAWRDETRRNTLPNVSGLLQRGSNLRKSCPSSFNTIKHKFSQALLNSQVFFKRFRLPLCRTYTSDSRRTDTVTVLHGIQLHLLKPMPLLQILGSIYKPTKCENKLPPIPTCRRSLYIINLHDKEK